VEANPQFTKMRGTCEITKYADSYIDMLKVNPFSKYANAGAQKEEGGK